MCCKSFWLFVLFQIIVVSVLKKITDPIFVDIRFNPIVAIYWIITLIPLIAIKVRRLHDTGRSGWWLLLQLLPILVAIISSRSVFFILLILVNIILLIFFLQDSIPGDNKYGGI